MHAEPAPTPLEILPTSCVSATSAGRVLACMQFGLRDLRHENPRVTPVQLEVVEGVDAAQIQGETWLSHTPVTTGVTEGIHHADNGEILFGWIHLPEAQIQDVEQASCEAHLKLHRLLHSRGFPHWLRAWNYLSRINEGEGDRERYRQFTAGRYRALAEAYAGTAQFERLLPAATAIGTRGDAGLTLCFFAGRRPGIQVENPRQVSAFKYPRHYGPRSPSFSRATLQHWRDRAILFVSGTASIVGHATLHPGNAAAQFEETLCNLAALVEHAAQEHAASAHKPAFRPRSFKLYVRGRQDFAALGTRWREALAAHAPTFVLIGDLCRSDLLVEVEAIYERNCP